MKLTEFKKVVGMIPKSPKNHVSQQISSTGLEVVYSNLTQTLYWNHKAEPGTHCRKTALKAGFSAASVFNLTDDLTPARIGVNTRNDLPSSVFEDIEKFIPFCGGDDLRPALQGVCFDWPSRVATTGSILLYDNTGEHCEDLPKLIVPGEALKVIVFLMDLPGTTHFYYGKEGCADILFLVKDDVSYSVRCIEGEYPGWKRVIPDVTENHLCSTETVGNMKHAVKTFLPIADSGNLVLEIRQDMAVFGRNEKRFYIDLQFDLPGTEPISFNIFCLEKVLRLTDATSFMSMAKTLNYSTKAALFHANSDTMLLMPIMNDFGGCRSDMIKYGETV